MCKQVFRIVSIYISDKGKARGKKGRKGFRDKNSNPRQRNELKSKEEIFKQRKKKERISERQKKGRAKNQKRKQTKRT